MDSLEFNVYISKHNGKPVLYIQREIMNKEDILFLLDKVRLNGKVDLPCSIKVNKPMEFEARLKNERLIP